MFVRIGNTPRDYAWGSSTALAELLGTRPSGGPEAELWLGAHPGSPSVILDPSETGGATNLAEWIERDPAETLGSGAAQDAPPRLPFLLKVLAAAGPLSLQAHPSTEQAREGFARENAMGLPLDSPERNYKDPWHKPELIYVVSERFDALCGYREPQQSVAVLRALADASDADGRRLVDDLTRRLAAMPAERALRDATAWLLGGGSDVTRLVASVVAAAERVQDAVSSDAALAADTVRMLSRAFPGDPGIVLALLLNRVTLTRGEALYLPAGNIHAYLGGLGIELMAASDNVLRGGLTAKKVDVTELLSVLDFRPIVVSTLVPDDSTPGVKVYRPDEPDFALDVVTLDAGVPSASVALPGPAIAICTAGSVELRGSGGGLLLSRGEAVYVTPDEGELVLSGEGRAFVATTNGRTAG